MENAENEYGLQDIEKIELCDLIAEAANFLTNNNNDAGQTYLSIAIAEGVITKTRTSIKKYVLKSYKSLLSSNNAIRIMNNPLYRMIYSNIDYEQTSDLLDYFENEKECIQTLKNFLNAKIEMPTASFTGIFTSTLIHIHNVNIDKINAIIDISKSVNNSPFKLTLPSHYTTPYNEEMVKDINDKINKVLIKEQN